MNIFPPLIYENLQIILLFSHHENFSKIVKMCVQMDNILYVDKGNLLFRILSQFISSFTVFIEKEAEFNKQLFYFLSFRFP